MTTSGKDEKIIATSLVTKKKTANKKKKKVISLPQRSLIIIFSLLRTFILWNYWFNIIFVRKECAEKFSAWPTFQNLTKYQKYSFNLFLVNPKVYSSFSYKFILILKVWQTWTFVPAKKIVFQKDGFSIDTATTLTTFTSQTMSIYKITKNDLPFIKTYYLLFHKEINVKTHFF